MNALSGALLRIPASRAHSDRLRAGLCPLLEMKARVFNAGDSCSMKRECAEALFESICYVVASYLETLAPDEAARVLETQSALTILRDGEDALRERIRAAELLYQKVERTRIRTENILYNDTIREIGRFFKAYRPDILAHELPCAIDYPLCRPMLALDFLGVSYIA